MPTPSIPSKWRPGLRAAVLSVSGALVIGTAFLVADRVAEHQRATAVSEAVGTTESVVRGYIDPIVTESVMTDPNGPAGQALDAELARLVSAGKILRIKVWDRTGTIVFSDLPQLRGRDFGVADDLDEAFAGETSTEFSDGGDAENVFERGLADEFLSMYLPIRAAGSDTVIGAYEVYEDAGPIEADIAQTRQDVLLIVGSLAALLLALLFIAFSGTSRRLTLQNRRLRDQAATEERLMDDLRRSQERFRSLVQNSADVNMIVAADGTIVYESPAVARVLGYQADERIGHEALESIHPDDQAWARQLLADIVRTPGSQITGEFRVRHADGTWRILEAVGKNLLDDPAVAGLVVNYRDITMRKSLEDELRHQAFHDSLTGLANRALFRDRLEHALARSRRGSQPLAVLFVDLDDFKNVNDSLGHGEGDGLLVAVAARLRDALRAGDTIARMGGDEFAILVEDPPDAGSPVEVAERLLAALQAPFEQAGRDLFVHASIGVAVSGSRKQTADELLRNADVSMYTAKADGKNRVEVFDPSMHEAAVARLALRVDLERAIERHEFFVLYQPVIDLRTGFMAGVEALVRWQHPDRGVIEPNEFIATAEETGLIVPLGRFVLETACRQVAAWDEEHPDHRLTVAVNVSGRQVTERGFVDQVAAILASTSLEAGRLVLEFTEGVLIQDTDATISVLHALRRLGLRLAIDDFGTGYSSLSYLRQFPIDILKVDRSFVANLDQGRPDETALMQSILGLSASLQLETVAEGIEQPAQLAELRLLGADLGQGFLFDRPLPAEQVSERLAAGGRAADPAGSADDEQRRSEVA